MILRRLIAPARPILRCLFVAGLLAGAWVFAATARANDAREREEAGDTAWRRAARHYKDAVGIWDTFAVRASAQKDGAAVARAELARARCGLLLRSPALYRKHAAVLRSTGRAPSPARLDLWASGAPVPSAEQLARLGSFLAAARASSARGALDPRDVLLVEEGAALVARFSGDRLQREADDAYRGALERVRAGSPRAESGAALAAAEVRLLYKLRRLDEARELLARARIDDGELEREARIDHLRTAWALASFAGTEQEALAYEGALRSLGSVAEEPARPGASFARLVQGATVDLVETVKTLVEILAHHKLPARNATVAALLAAGAAIELGDHPLAGELLAARLPDPAEDAWLAIACHTRLGRARSMLGDYETALESLALAARLAAGLEGTAILRARVALNQASAFLGLGQTNEARRAVLDALATFELPADLRVRARVLLGNVLYERARADVALLPDARAAFETATRELEGALAEDPAAAAGKELQATVAINLANVLRREALVEERGGPLTEASRGRRERAIAIQDAAMRAADESGAAALAALAAANLGELYLEGGDLATAEKYIDWAVRWAEELALFETLWRCHWYRGRIADRRGDDARADGEYARALAAVESCRGRLLQLDLKSGFLNDKVALFQDVVRRELARGRVEAALEVAERAKARTLVESLGWRLLALGDPAQTEQYRLFVRLLAQNAAGAGAGTFFGARAQRPPPAEIRTQLAAFKSALAAKSGQHPLLRRLVDGDPATTAEILQLAPERTAILEYFFLADRALLFVVTERRVEAIELAVGSGELTGLVRDFLAGHAGDSELARRLHGLLLDPALPRLRDERVIVVPYGVLHHLPFEALRGADGRHVVERWAVSYLPAAGALRYFRERARGRARDAKLLAFVDPDTDYDRDGRFDLPALPGARREVESFAALFTDKEVLLGASALEIAALQRAGGRDVIHYACHGEFHSSNPWDSCLFLAGGTDPLPENDGRLRAAEVLGIDLRSSRLVALSGCETGRVDVLPGDDTISIGTAFLHAGAGALLASLWKVEDAATAALMQSFYRHWIEDGVDKVSALRSAKLELLHGEFEHPRQWSSFILIGEP